MIVSLLHVRIEEVVPSPLLTTASQESLVARIKVEEHPSSVSNLHT